MKLILELFAAVVISLGCVFGMCGVFCAILFAFTGRNIFDDMRQRRIRKQNGIPVWISESTLAAMAQEGRYMSIDERVHADFAEYQKKMVPADAELFLIFFWEDNRRSNQWEKDIDFFIFTRLPLEDDVYELLQQYLDLHPYVDETKVLFTVRSAREFETPRCYRMSYVMDDEY